MLERRSRSEDRDRASRAALEPSSPFYLRASEFGGYRVERVLSTGALGAVVTARHRQQEQPVVIKLLHPELRNDAASSARISREAHVLARIPHPNIVRLLDTGWTEQVGPYLVLEHLVGIDLARMLETRGALPVQLAVDFLLQACDALSAAHGAGITHRDLKPENLFSVETGGPSLKLLDFGIAQHGPESFPHREVAAARDSEGPLLGTPAYLSPERIHSLPNTDHRCDIWSLGVVLHELVTGRTPFGRDNPSEVCARVLRHEFELESNRALLPSPLRAVILRCLGHHPVSRYQSVQELADALLRATTLPDRCRGQLTGKFNREAVPPSAPSQPQHGPVPIQDAPAAPIASQGAAPVGAAARLIYWLFVRRGTILALVIAVVLVLLFALAVS
jgi:serine/threonine protein kinase